MTNEFLFHFMLHCSHTMQTKCKEAKVSHSHTCRVVENSARVFLSCWPSFKAIFVQVQHAQVPQTPQAVSASVGGHQKISSITPNKSPRICRISNKIKLFNLKLQANERDFVTKAPNATGNLSTELVVFKAQELYLSQLLKHLWNLTCGWGAAMPSSVEILHQTLEVL